MTFYRCDFCKKEMPKREMKVVMVCGQVNPEKRSRSFLGMDIIRELDACPDCLREKFGIDGEPDDNTD